MCLSELSAGIVKTGPETTEAEVPPIPVRIMFSSSEQRLWYRRAKPIARMEMEIAASMSWPT